MSVLRKAGARRRWIGLGFLMLLTLVAYPLAARDLSLIDRISHRVGGPSETTPPPDLASSGEVVRLAAVGDVGTGDDEERATAEAIARRGRSAGFDALLLLGDNVYPSGDPGRVDSTVFGPFEETLASGAKLVPALGNHDVVNGNGSAQLAALWRERSWYSERVGPVQVIVLDSNRPGDPDQLAWLTSEMGKDFPGWRVAMMHHPMYSAGQHGSDELTRAAFEDLLVAGGVDLVLAGHDHDEQRSKPIEGVTHVVSGGGAKLRRTGRENFTVYSASTRHFVEIGVWRDRMRLTAIDQDGRAFDDVVLRGR